MPLTSFCGCGGMTQVLMSIKSQGSSDSPLQASGSTYPWQQACCVAGHLRIEMTLIVYKLHDWIGLLIQDYSQGHKPHSDLQGFEYLGQGLGHCNVSARDSQPGPGTYNLSTTTIPPHTAATRPLQSQPA